MFDPTAIIDELARDRWIFEHVLVGVAPQLQQFRPAPGQWNLLEIVCHLYDEERDDFRARVRHALEGPAQAPPPIDPQGWVVARNYAGQDYATRVQDWLRERDASVAWLRQPGLRDWDRAFPHPRFGAMPARMFLINWLAHDRLHLRQILYNEHRFLHATTGDDLSYAGTW
jgi:hypothetical protein